MARGGAARRSGDVLHPAGRGQHRTVRQPQPGLHHGRRGRERLREPTPARASSRVRARERAHRVSGPRRRDRCATTGRRTAFPTFGRRPIRPRPTAMPRRSPGWRRSSSLPTASRSRSAGPGGVAMLHCGWRGLAAGIIERGVAEVGADGGSDRARASGRCCFEVGEEVLARFERSRRGHRRRPHARPGRGRWAPARGGRRDRDRARRPLHELRARAVLLAPPRPGRDRPPGGGGDRHGRADHARSIRPSSARTSTGSASGRARAFEILVATKYVPDERPCRRLRRPGSSWSARTAFRTSSASRALAGDRFEWHFIGALQSRKVRDDRSAGAPDPLALRPTRPSRSSSAHAPPGTEVLVQVNVAGEESKAGVAPADLAASSPAARSASSA